MSSKHWLIEKYLILWLCYFEIKMIHRHDISDKLWERIEGKIPWSKGYTGRPAYDNRRFINAVFWILRTGAPWRGLPKDYGDWKIRIADFVDGAIWECGKKFLRWWLENLIYNGWWLIRHSANVINTRPERLGGMRRSVSKKGAKQQGTCGRGCAWYAAQSYCYKRYRRWLQKSYRIDLRFSNKILVGG